VRNYRAYFVGQLISVSGTWMQTVAQAFLVLHLTNSGTELGLATGARFAPMLFFGPFGGVIADRVNKRRLLYVTQILQGVLAGVLAVIVGAGVVKMWMVFILAAALGFVNVFDNPARQSFISELVPESELQNAVTLNSVTMNIARIFGPALAGLLIATTGVAWCFAANGLSFGAVVISLAVMNTKTLFTAAPTKRQPRQVREGFAYVRSTPELLVPLLMIAVVGTFAWEFQVSLPLVAKDTFHGGAGTYGLMMSIMGAGAVVGGLVTAARKVHGTRSLAIASIGWGISLGVAAIAPSLTTEFVVLLFVGYGSISFNALGKTALQLSSSPDMRGRVMALWSLAWLGSTPIGGPIVGFVGSELGARWTLVVGAVPTVLAGLLAWKTLTGIDARHRAAGLAPLVAIDEPGAGNKQILEVR
jgi:MFS family permease